MSQSYHRTLTGLVEPSFEDPIILVVRSEELTTDLSQRWGHDKLVTNVHLKLVRHPRIETKLMCSISFHPGVMFTS
jgi:hypothetical protein